MSETIISHTSTSALIYSDAGADFHILVSDLTYLPMYGVDQDFLYLANTNQLKLNNITIDAKNSGGDSSNDIIYSYATECMTSMGDPIQQFLI